MGLYIAALRAQGPRICLPMQGTRVRSLGREDPLEEEMATHSSILAWRIPRREEPGRVQSVGSQKIQTRLSDYTATKTHIPAPVWGKILFSFYMDSLDICGSGWLSVKLSSIYINVWVCECVFL